MTIEELSRSQSIKAWNEWITSGQALPEVNTEYSKVRSELKLLFNQVKNSGAKLKSYDFDVEYGIKLYGYFQDKQIDNLRNASNDGFWRYLSLIVVPDLVYQRFDNADHFYGKSSRIWLKTLWWYVHLSWQGSLEKTRTFLKSGRFSTDTILNLVERTGAGGTNIALYRTIMTGYGAKEEISDANFRKIMKMNTVKTLVVEPDLYDGGITGYVNSIITELGIK